MSEAMEQRGSLDRRAAAEYLSICPNTLDQLVKRGSIGRVKVGAKPLFPRFELDRFLQANLTNETQGTQNMAGFFRNEDPGIARLNREELESLRNKHDFTIGQISRMTGAPADDIEQFLRDVEPSWRSGGIAFYRRADVSRVMAAFGSRLS